MIYSLLGREQWGLVHPMEQQLCSLIHRSIYGRVVTPHTVWITPDSWFYSYFAVETVALWTPCTVWCNRPFDLRRWYLETTRSVCLNLAWACHCTYDAGRLGPTSHEQEASSDTIMLPLTLDVETFWFWVMYESRMSRNIRTRSHFQRHGPIFWPGRGHGR